MKQASSQEAFDDLLDVLLSGSSHPIAKVLYQADDLAWNELEDIQSIGVNIKGIDNRYGAFSLLPPVSDMSVSMNNAAEKYSDGSGSPLEGILTRNRKLRCYLGYQFFGDTLQSAIQNLTSEALTLYHAELSGGYARSKSAYSGAGPSLSGIPWNTYGSGTYGSGTYAPEGYYLSKIKRFEDVAGIEIFADNSKIDLWYRFGSTAAEAGAANFTYIGPAPAYGSISYALSHLHVNKYFQWAVIFRTGIWGLGNLQGLTVKSYSNLEYFDQGIFLSDDPEFTSAKSSYTASFNARDHMKKAIETKISLFGITAIDIVEVIRRAASKAGIPWDAASLPYLGKLVTVPTARAFNNVTAQAVFEECTSFIAGALPGNYRLVMSADGKLSLQAKPLSATNADYVLHYVYDLFNISKKKSSNNLLQAAQVLSQEGTVQEAQELYNGTKTTAGDHVLTLSYSAIYKEVEVYYQTSDPSVTVEILNTELNSVTVRIAGTGTIDIKFIINGNRFSGTAPYAGECISTVNHIISRAAQGAGGSEQKRDGITHKFISRFISSNAEAKSIAEKMISEYGDKKYQLSVTIWGLPIAEVGDKFMNFEKYTATNSIFVLESISHNYNAKGASFKTTLNFTDLGFTLQNFIWSRNGLRPGALDILWSRGFIWSQDLGYVPADTADYENTKPIRFA